jgi:4-amino-4-deoxy-L-arabinose transferase-like glycosyltransferase
VRAEFEARLPGWLRKPWAPAVLLGVVCALSLGARVFHLDIPGADGQYVFDERYYVNAARVIVGAPMQPTDTYAHLAPRGADPNGEHPQLGKAIIGASISLLGDHPAAWRLPVALFATLALALLFWVVRRLGGSPWLSLGVVAIAAAENLWLVSGRIGVLEMLCIPFMLAGFGFYLDRQPVVAGILLGVGSCVKELCLYALIAILLLELLRAARWLATDRARVSRTRFAMPVVVTAVWLFTFFSLLGVLDAIVPPYHNGHPVDRGQAAVCGDFALWSDACNHFAFMNDYAARLRGPVAAHSITGHPWEFWLDQPPIPYYTETRAVHSGSKLVGLDTVLSFQGLVNPVLLFSGWLAIPLAAWWAWRRRDDLSLFVVAWVIATWLPVELANLVDQRLTYLYYMAYTLPALFVAVALVLARLPRLLTGVWIGAYLSAFALLYPFRTLSGG